MFERFTPGRCLLLLILTSCFLLFTLVPHYHLIHHEDKNLGIVARDLVLPTIDPSTTTPTAGGSTSSTSSTPVQSSPPSTSPTTSSTINSETSTTSPTTSPTTSSSSTPTPTDTSPHQTTTQQPLATSQVESTGADGQVFTSIVTVSASSTSASSSSSPSPSSGSSSDSGGGSSKLGTGSIVGMSVCGGVALIGIIAFVVWKVTRKRASDRFDDSEAIKWPELNNENHGATAGGFSSEVSLTHGGSMHRYSGSIGTASQSHVDLNAGDPYAVPPLPHLNPNQPQQYHDDPNAGGFYDPYPGPVPTTFHNPPDSPRLRGDAIPMTQITPGPRARSPGPQLGLLGGRASPAPSMGRQSPGPYAAMPRSPAPSVGYGSTPVAGRQSPGPQDAYGYGR